VTAWTGTWRLPTDKRDHQRAVRRQRRKDRCDVANHLSHVHHCPVSENRRPKLEIFQSRLWIIIARDMRRVYDRR
jgi:hypothetical protein